jgi:glycogen(starch) synthase
LRVLWITDTYPPDKGGVATSAKRLVNNLRDTGLTVDVLALTSTGIGTQEDITPPFCPKEGGVEVIVKKQTKVHQTLQVIYHNIRRMHKQRNYSLIHGFFAVPGGYVAAYAAKALNLPVVISFRGNDIDEVLFDYANKPFLNDTLKWADGISYLSEEMLRNLKVLKPEGPFFYTPNSVDTERFNFSNADINKIAEIKHQLCPQKERLLGIAGEFKFKKGLNFLLKNLPEIQKMEKTKLLVIGTVSKQDKQVLLDNPYVIYKEYINSFELLLFYAAMDFFVLPSFFEGFPNVMLESMAAGTVNISSDIAGMRDVIQDNENGFLFFPLDKDDFLKAVERAYTLTPRQLAVFRQKAKEQALNFTSERETAGYLRMYTEIVAGRS